MFETGDRVFYAGAYDRPGCDSEYQAVDERIVGHAPANLTLAQSAALPLTSLTAWESLFEQMAIDYRDHEANAKKSILIINGGGGVGSIATQLAHLANLQVVTTAGNEKTKEWSKQQGADYVLDYHEDLVEQAQAIGFADFDYILELTNLDQYWPVITKLIAPLGNVVSTTGSGKNLDFSPLKSKMIRFGWEWMYSKSWFQRDMESQHQILEQVRQWLDEGKLSTTLTKTITPINAANLRTATELIETNHTLGKIVLKDW